MGLIVLDEALDISYRFSYYFGGDHSVVKPRGSVLKEEFLINYN